MKRPSENRGPATMPSFLDDATEEPVAGLQSQAHDEDAEPAVDEEAEEADAEDHEAYATADEADDDVSADGADEDEFEPADEAARERPVAGRPARTAQRARRTAESQSSGGGAASVIGIVLALAAGIATQVPAAVELLAQRHLDPQLLAMFGLLLWTVGRGQSRSTALQRRLGELEQNRNDVDDELRDALAQLQDRSTPQDSTVDNGDLQHLMLSLQRQDQKINNLTKAIKMYGKPLMDIASQGTDIAGAVAQVRVAIEAGAESSRTANQRIEDQLRKANKQVDLGDLPDQVRQLGVTLAAVTQRLEDSEVRKSLVRLEDFAKELRQEVQVLQRGEPTQAAAEAMIARLEEARKGLAAGIQQLRDGNLSGLESSVRELMREVSSLATSTAQIQAAVKSGARAAPASAAPTSAAAPTPAATAPAAAAAAAPTTPPAGGDAVGDDAGGYQTGKRTSGGKNVLGAIARLKQMKG